MNLRSAWQSTPSVLLLLTWDKPLSQISHNSQTGLAVFYLCSFSSETYRSNKKPKINASWVAQDSELHQDLCIATGHNQISNLDSASNRNYFSIVSSSGVGYHPVFTARYAGKPPLSSHWDEPFQRMQVS